MKAIAKCLFAASVLLAGGASAQVGNNTAVLDPNLRALARKLKVRTLVAHLRGVPLDGSAVINQQNLHPFFMPGSPLVLAHNGDLAHFSQMRFALVEHLKPEIASRLSASTDSAWLHALVLSQLDDPAGPFTSDEIHGATERGAVVWLVGLNPSALEVVRNAGLYERLGRERMLFNARAAIERYQALLAKAGGTS